MNEVIKQTSSDELLSSGKLHKAHLYIKSRHKNLTKEKKKKLFLPCITISRETGAGSKDVSNYLLKYIEENKIFSSQKWAVFDQNLIEKVLEHHNLPKRLAELMSEKKHSDIKSYITELFSNQPASWTLVQKTMATILQLAEAGNSIIIGRGGSIITANLKNTLHIRLVANLQDRVKRIQSVLNFTREEAKIYIIKKDSDRKKYIKTYFNKDITDPQLYHLILNTSICTCKQAGELIGKLVEIYFEKYITQRA